MHMKGVCSYYHYWKCGKLQYVPNAQYCILELTQTFHNPGHIDQCGGQALLCTQVLTLYATCYIIWLHCCVHKPAAKVHGECTVESTVNFGGFFKTCQKPIKFTTSAMWR